MLFELSVRPADVSITSVTSTESVAVEPTPPSARSRPSPAVRTLSFVRVVSSEPFVITTYEAPGGAEDALCRLFTVIFLRAPASSS